MAHPLGNAGRSAARRMRGKIRLRRKAIAATDAVASGVGRAARCAPLGHDIAGEQIPDAWGPAMTLGRSQASVTAALAARRDRARGAHLWARAADAIAPADA